MNKCMFFGTLSDVRSMANEDGSIAASLTLEVSNKRANQGSKIIDRELLQFEVWGTAATYLLTNAQVGCKILVSDATARYHERDVVFRINDFKII